MADQNRYQGQDQRDDYDRSQRRDRQPQQYQSDRSYYSDEYGSDSNARYRQTNEDSSQGRYNRQQNEDGYQSERQGQSWRDDDESRSGGRSYGGGSNGGFGAARFTNRERGGFGSFTSDGFRNGGNVGPRENLAYGRGGSMGSGAYSGGSYGPGTYGAAPRRDYGSDDDRGFFQRAGDEVASWFGDDDAARRREQDHSGRGPANYTRSDDRILEDACDKLTEDWGVDARNVQVTVQGGEVTLDGTVENRSQKRRAEDVVHEISGVGHVQNNLRTQDRSRSVDDTSNTGINNTGTSERNPGTLA